jgi:hypothetical protein
MSPDLGATLSRGAEFAAAAGALDVTLEHVLAALCDDRDAIAVLDASNVDIAALKADVIGQFPQADPDSAEAPVSLGVAQDVRRILEAASAAARGSRRRDINGAIVLAAIVGDGRSAAAQMLQAHGLTFDGAIRALQAALAPAPQRAPSPPPPVADDVLARARERVQSRSAPSLRDLMQDVPRPTQPPHVSTADVAQTIEPKAPERTISEPEAAAAPAEQEPVPPASSAVPSAPAAAGSAFPAPTDRNEPKPPFPQSAASRGAPHAAPLKADAPPDRALQSFSESVRNPGVQRPQRPGAEIAPAASPIPEPPSSPSLPFPAQGPSQNQSSQSAPAPVGRDAAPGGPFPSDFSRPRPSGAQPPPIPTPPSAMSPGMRARGPAPGAGHGTNPGIGSFSGPAPSPIAPPGPLQGDERFRSDDQLDRPRPGTPAPQPRPQPSKGGKAAGRKRAKGKADTGQLAENIPRTMRVGHTERVEVRIAKASLAALTEGLEGGGAVWQHQVTLTKAMAVRIRAPEGGFFVETASPETQWIENSMGFASDDFASWRFLITPQSRGWSRLQIIVSARTIGADGVAAETALPDQIVEIKVRRNLAQTFGRVTGWAVAAVVGGVLASFGGTGIAVMKTLLLGLFH